MPTADAFEAAVGRHDARVAALALTVWVGSEPTFTDRHAQTPEWISQALGGEKEERALAATAALFRRFPRRRGAAQRRPPVPGRGPPALEPGTLSPPRWPVAVGQGHPTRWRCRLQPRRRAGRLTWRPGSPRWKALPLRAAGPSRGCPRRTPMNDGSWCASMTRWRSRPPTMHGWAAHRCTGAPLRPAACVMNWPSAGCICSCSPHPSGTAPVPPCWSCRCSSSRHCFGMCCR
jgi:hypothetical protein